MTGVKSKRAWLLKEKELDTQILDGSIDEFAIVVCDVNGLKKVNDTYGHKAGDDYIRAACRMVCDIFAHSPVFRVGGDEFTIVLTDGDYAHRQDLMTILHDRSVEHIAEGGAVVSGGISCFERGKDATMHDVFSRADNLMYEEKLVLKSLGAVTRDNESDAAQDGEDGAQQSIIEGKRHLLIVDDEAINREMLNMALEGSYEVVNAANGLEALEKIRALKDDLAAILLDLLMPEMSGIEVLKILVNDEELKGIPVIVMTADQEAELECLNLGAMDFIPKPYPRFEIILARVNKCVELSEDREIIRATERDALTSLFNMGYFLRYVSMFDQHYWESPMDAVSLVVDDFAGFSDTHGKERGERVLRGIGERLRRLSRELGGVGSRASEDTFVVYCPHQEGYDAALGRLTDGLWWDAAHTVPVRLKVGVWANVDKMVGVEQRFEWARAASDDSGNA